MASANAYAGGFIGNDFTLPRRRPVQSKIEEPQIETLTIHQQEPVPVTVGSVAESRPFAIPVVAKKPWVRARVFNLRTAGLFGALVVSSMLLYATVSGVKHTNTIAAIGSTASSLQQRVSSNIHHTPVYISLPQYSLAIKNVDLSHDIANIKAQSITINFSFAGVIPQSSEIGQWVKTSAGPKAGTTLLAVNTSALSSYLNKEVKLYDRAPTDKVISMASGTPQVVNNGSFGISYYGVSGATNAIASKLLKANGASTSLSSTIVPSSTRTIK